MSKKGRKLELEGKKEILKNKRRRGKNCQANIKTSG